MEAFLIKKKKDLKKKQNSSLNGGIFLIILLDGVLCIFERRKYIFYFHIPSA